MSDYVAPLKEMNFVLSNLAGLSEICDMPGFEDAGIDVVEAVLEEASKLACGVVAPLNIKGDETGTKVVDGEVIEVEGFNEAYQQFVEGGWNALGANPEFGGMGLPEVVAAATSEMWAAANTSFALCPMLTQGASNALEVHGSDELKANYLPKMISGEWTGTMNLTEPQAGSDLSAVRSKAVPEGDRFRITGTKIFITWGDHGMTDNVIHLVLARLPDAPEGVKGISLFLVPKFLLNDDGSLGARNDAFAVSVEHKLGIHASPTCVMSFGETQEVEGAHGAIGYLIGKEHQGLAHMFTMMNHARLHVGMQGVALSDRAYQHAVVYAKERTQGRTPGDTEMATIIRHPDVRRSLLVMRSLTEASRAVNYVAAACYDVVHHGDDAEQKAAANARVEWLTPIAKGWATEIAQEVTSLGVQCHGGMGFIEETGAAQYMRDARITSIYEGTTAIQANDLVGRKLARDNGVEISKVIAEIRATEAELEAAGDDFTLMTSALAEGVDQLESVKDWILENYANDPRLQGTASFNFLMLAGTVVGGWMMAKSALVAKAKLSEDEVFYSAKLTTARIYAEHILPRSISYAASAKANSATLMSMSDDQF